MKNTIISIILMSFVCLLAWNRAYRHEIEIDRAWLDGYRAYQADRYMPQPNHKAPLPGLKGKVQG